MGSIYRVWNTVNSKSYIGQSYRPYGRMLDHLTGSEEGSSAIQDDLLNYPPDSWQWEILDNNDDDGGTLFEISNNARLNDLERKYIRQYDSICNGYNIMPGGGVIRYRKTEEESYLRSQMQRMIYQQSHGYMEPERYREWQQDTQVILDAIDDYQGREAYRRWRQETRRRQEEAEQRWQEEEERQQQREEQRRQDAPYLQRYGMTRNQYEQIISRYGSWEAYQRYQRQKVEEEARSDRIAAGCAWVFGIILLIILGQQC